jgi:hypothetical protein
MTPKKKTSVVWAPQAGPQEALITCPYPLIGFGGARGGGKTDGVLGMFGLKQKLYKQNFNAVFFRREMPQADDLIERAMQLYVPLGATFQAQKRQFTFPDGGRLRFRPLYNDADAAKYQGQNLSDAAVEEAGNYPDPAPIWKLFGALRGGAIDQPIQLILTFNPGGAGHYWLREKFVKPAPLGMKRLEWKLDTGDNIPYVYIPSRITDNQILLAKDPQYIQRLHMVGSAELVRAWLEGDFEIHAGSYFPEFGQKHIVAPFPIPQHWQRYLAFDWGFRSPYCAVWGAISSGKDDSGKEVPYPKNSIVIYRELMAKGQDNVTIGENIGQRCSGETISRAVADPSIFSNEGGPSIHDQIKPGLIKHRVPIFQRGDNDRLSGWSQIRQRLQENMIFFFSTCNYLLDTLPALQVCPKRPEDVDTTGEDHGADALRYLCKERLLESTYKKADEPIQKGLLKVQQYVQQVRAEARRARL